MVPEKFTRFKRIANEIVKKLGLDLLWLTYFFLPLLILHINELGSRSTME